MNKYKTHNSCSYRRLSTINKNECIKSSEDSPVCPPMWNCPVPMIQRVPTRNIIKVDEPIIELPMPLPRPRPVPSDTPTSGSVHPSDNDNTGGRGIDDRIVPFCRYCGPEIKGVIGRPSSDLNDPWPAADADTGIEVFPFVLPGADSPCSSWSRVRSGPYSTLFRTQGVYTPPYRVFTDVVEHTTNASYSFGAAGGAAPNNVINLISTQGLRQTNGFVFMSDYQFSYASVNSAQRRLEGVVWLGLSELPAGSARPGQIPSGCIAVQFQESRNVDNNSASFQVTVEGQGQISSEPWTGLTLTNDSQARGRGYINNSYIQIFNSDLQSPENIGGERAGCIYFQIKTTTWPDRDVSSCVLSTSSGASNLYCCGNNFLTPDTWGNLSDRCNPPASYARPAEAGGQFPQLCPSGYVFDPVQADDDDDGRLPCRKCENNTTSWNPAQLTAGIGPRGYLANPPCSTTGNGCQKCCGETNTWINPDGTIETGGMTQC
jgi:hypothetical protein